MSVSYALAIDVGGTFTDAVLRGSDGSLVVDKTLTTPHDLQEGFFRGIDLVLGKAVLRPSQVDGVVVHATTVVTNALIERRGAPTALLVTRGLADVLAIRNEHRHKMYDPQIEFPEPLIPRAAMFEVTERVLADGEVLHAFDPTEIAAIARRLADAGIVSVAVCLLNSFRNPANETAVAEALHVAMPSLYVSISSSVAPQIREYPRASTTAMNACTAPITQPYLDGLSRRLEQIGMPSRPLRRIPGHRTGCIPMVTASAWRSAVSWRRFWRCRRARGIGRRPAARMPWRCKSSWLRG